MFVASVGSSLALDMGLIARAEAVEQESRVTFGEMEPLVDFLQSTPVEKLLPQVAQRVQSGTPLQSLVAAAALANARAFGGEDYIGFHTLMALGPALAMSKELPSEQAALPDHVALVDDVMTTGATLAAAAHALRAAGVERVDAWVCARVP